VGVSRWSAGKRFFEVSYGSAGAERINRKVYSIMGKEQSFEGRSPGALGVGRDSSGLRQADTAVRVTKPCVWDFWKPGHTVFRRFSVTESEKKGALS
jgi:hypothetical protein